MTRPVGVPFAGESLGLDYVRTLAGTAPPDFVSNGYSPLAMRYGSFAFAAGADYTAGVRSDVVTLESGDVADVSWVIVALSGSAVVHLHEGLDTAYNEDLDPAYTTTDLGTHTLIAGDNVFASVVTDVATILAYTAQPVLRIEVLSGSVEVQQIKMRVWPPGGALGAWSEEFPGYDLPEQTVASIVQIGSGGAGAVEVAASFVSEWAAVQATARAATTAPPTSVRAVPTFATGETLAIGVSHEFDSIYYADGDGIHTDQGQTTLTATTQDVVLFYAELAVDGGIPGAGDPPPAPDEVSGDVTWYKQSGAAPERVWSHDSVLTVSSNAGVTSGPALLGIVPVTSPVSQTDFDGVDSSYEWADYPAASFGTATVATTPGGTLTASLPLSAGADVLGFIIGYQSPILSADAAFPGGPLSPFVTPGAGAISEGWTAYLGTGTTEDFTPISWHDVQSSFRVWNPVGAPPVTYLRHRVRDDGLAGNAPRVRNRSSNQRSLRHHGYR